MVSLSESQASHAHCACSVGGGEGLACCRNVLPWPLWNYPYNDPPSQIPRPPPPRPHSQIPRPPLSDPMASPSQIPLPDPMASPLWSHGLTLHETCSDLRRLRMLSNNHGGVCRTMRSGTYSYRNRNRALFLHTTRDVINRRPWPRFNIHLQASCHPPGRKMEPTLYLHNELAEMPPLVLTPKIFNPSHQRRSFNCRQGLKSNFSSNRLVTMQWVTDNRPLILEHWHNYCTVHWTNLPLLSVCIMHFLREKNKYMYAYQWRRKIFCADSSLASFSY